MAIASSSKSSFPPALNVPVVTVDPHKAIDVVKNVFKHNFGPLLEAVPSLTAGESEMTAAYNNLFNQVAIDFKEELAKIAKESEGEDKSTSVGKQSAKDPTADFKPGGKIYDHVTVLDPGNVHVIRNWQESRNVYIQMNKFFGAIKGIGDPEVKLKAMNHFLSMHLACANGVRERLADILAPLLPGNKLITTAFTNAREKFLITSGIAAKEQSIHAAARFEKGVLNSPPSREGKEFTETSFKCELENAIETFLETDLQNLFNGLTELFKEAPQPLQLEPLSEEKPFYTEKEKPILAAFQKEVRAFTKEIIKFHEEHLMECAYFLPETTGLEESISHMRMDENDGRFVSFSRENIIADVAEKILPVLTLEAKLRLFQRNPEFFAIPKLLADLLAGEPEHLEQITDAIDAAFPGEPNKIRELMGKTDEASGTGNTTLHFLLQKGASVSNMLGRDCIPLDLLAQANLATPGHPKGQTPVDLIFANECLPDLMTVRLLCKRDRAGLGKILMPVLEKSELAKSKDLRDSLAENDKFITAMANLKEFSQLNAAQLAAIAQATSVRDLEVPGSREASKRISKFVINNLERLSKLDAKQIGATGLAIRQSRSSADFVSKHTDPWFGSSTEAMKAYTRLLSTSVISTHGRSKLNLSGADSLHKNFEAFRRLDDRQKEETSLFFEQFPYFFNRNANVNDWFKLNATQMLWTRRAHKAGFVDVSHSWMKMPAAKMMQFVESIEAEAEKGAINPFALQKFDVLRKLSIMQMKHTLEMIKCKGGRQFFNAHFKTWTNLKEEEMKALLDVFKAGKGAVYPIDMRLWTQIALDDQLILARIARSGIGWNQLKNNVLDKVLDDNEVLVPGTTLTPQVIRFLNDVTYVQLFSRDPAMAAFPDRLTAVETACNNNVEFKNALTQQPKQLERMVRTELTEHLEGDERTYTLAEQSQLVPKKHKDGTPDESMLAYTLTAESDLISGLDHFQIAATAEMFSLEGGAEFIRNPQWKSYSTPKMNALCDAYEMKGAREKLQGLLKTNPEEVKKFGPGEIFEIMKNELVIDRTYFDLPENHSAGEQN